jgi:hypothetical protein
MEQNFKTCEFIHGITIELIDNNPYDYLDVEIFFGNISKGIYKVKHFIDIDGDQSTAIFKTFFKPFKSSEIIKITVKTDLLYKDLIKIYLHI